jgi:sulfide:quinone oxidoreductase
VRRGIKVIGDFSLSRSTATKRTLKAYDGRETELRPARDHPPARRRRGHLDQSGMGDAGGWLPTTSTRCRASRSERVRPRRRDRSALVEGRRGGALPVRGALRERAQRSSTASPLDAGFDGHANCFIETGYGKAMLIDFNYTTEPLPGRFPLPGVGPFTLLEESATNHWGKLAFKWVYWNVLLAGKELPLDHRMLMAGKWS